MSIALGTGSPTGPDLYPFPAVMHQVVADPDQVPDPGEVRVLFGKQRFFAYFEDLLVFCRERGPVKVVLVPPLLPNCPEQGLGCLIVEEICVVRRIGPELVYRGFKECDRGEERVEHECLVPETLLRWKRAGASVFLFQPEPHPAEECGGLDIAHGETVPEPDDDPIIGRLTVFFVHRTISFLFRTVKR